MRDIFANFYSKVAAFFKQSEHTSEQSKDVARNRLKLVLMQDRTNLTPKVLERMRGELINLLSKYVELDKELLELNFEQEGEQMALMLSIPVLRAKSEEEIQDAIQSEEAIKDITLASEEDDEDDEDEENNSEDDKNVENKNVEGEAENDDEVENVEDNQSSDEVQDPSQEDEELTEVETVSDSDDSASDETQKETSKN